MISIIQYINERLKLNKDSKIRNKSSLDYDENEIYNFDETMHILRDSELSWPKMIEINETNDGYSFDKFKWYKIKDKDNYFFILNTYLSGERTVLNIYAPKSINSSIRISLKTIDEFLNINKFYLAFNNARPFKAKGKFITKLINLLNDLINNLYILPEFIDIIMKFDYDCKKNKLYV